MYVYNATKGNNIFYQLQSCTNALYGAFTFSAILFGIDANDILEFRLLFNKDIMIVDSPGQYLNIKEI
jgi:hypothetical protein